MRSRRALKTTENSAGRWAKRSWIAWAGNWLKVVDNAGVFGSGMTKSFFLFKSGAFVAAGIADR
jgi:hypothetical protein